MIEKHSACFYRHIMTNCGHPFGANSTEPMKEMAHPELTAFELSSGRRFFTHALHGQASAQPERLDGYVNY
jgi:hypothetical protein